jgi:hypothetical protein
LPYSLILFAANAASAQQAIMNMPSADITQRQTLSHARNADPPLAAWAIVVWNEFLCLRDRTPDGVGDSFVVPGVLLHPSKQQMIIAGWKILTSAVNGKSGVVLEYGFTF